MLQAVLMLGGLGLIIGIALAAASRIFYVYVDPKIEAVEAALPGANCGGCGFPGCSANADAIVKGKSMPSSCVAGGSDLALTIAALLGVSVEAKEPDIARPDCTYSLNDSDVKFAYNGIGDCRAASTFYGGMKICNIGCLGLGTCVKACLFNALSIGPEGLPVVNSSRCTGCGMCERACPKHIIKLSSVTRRIMREYTIDDCTTPCQRTCPAGINIREYIRQIGLGNYNKAVEIIKERNPFPATIGRICPHPCETQCRRNLIDESVAINDLKRFAADYERSTGKRIFPYVAPATNRKIAVIGGGVQGLSTAFFATRLGHSVTVFEAESKLGGMLRKAITQDRLPSDVLDWDIQGILDMGVKAETGKKAGKDFTIPSLMQEGFNAIFLATGGWDSRLARNADKDVEQVIPNVYLLIDLMKKDVLESISCKGRVVILGKGASTLKAAKVCKDKGAQEVTILFGESEKDVELSKELLESAQKEGFKLQFETAVTKIIGQGNSLTQLECVSLSDKQKTVIPADIMFVSSGRFPELIFVKKESENIEILNWEGIQPYKQPVYKTEQGLLSKADEITDFSAAIKAIGASRRAAASIHQVMYGLPLELSDDVVTKDSDVQNVSTLQFVKSVPRNIMPVRPAKELVGNVEKEIGFTSEIAKNEADRCLKCGLVCYAKTMSTVIEADDSKLAKAA